jgi:RHS repeat-associated protein
MRSQRLPASALTWRPLACGRRRLRGELTRFALRSMSRAWIRISPCRTLRGRLVSALLGILLSQAICAADKNGVAPQAISLPSGPGSIQGLGESFQPQLNTGSGSTAVPIVLPKGTGGLTPQLALVYNSASGSSSLGLGWSLSGLPSIRRNTDRGVPFYTDGPDGIDNDADGRIDNPEELDTFTGIGGEELVQLPDGTFRAENEGAFVRYRRLGAGWEAQARDGGRYLFGQSAEGRIEDAGRVFEWCLERRIDKNGNAIDYEYLADPAGPPQKYLRRIRWGQAEAYFAAVLRYEEGRPDVTTSFRSGFELKTRLRLTGIDVISHGVPSPDFAVPGDLDGDGKVDALIRRYRLDHDPAAHLSLLVRVTLFGADGVTTLPSQSFAYGSWTPPDEAAAFIIRSHHAPPAAFESPSVELIDLNGDALPDLLSTAGSQHRVTLNRGVDAEGRLAWAPSRPVDSAPSIDIASERVHLADVDADGLADLLVKVSNTSFLCYSNTGRNAWMPSPFTIRITDTWPIWPYDGDPGALSRSFDSDYSRSNDILHTGASGNQLWLFLPGGRYSRELRFPPLICDGQVFRFDLPGTHIADLNGDRLQDLAWIQANRVVYFPNRGRGEFAAPVVLNLGRTLSAAEIQRAGFSDVDGDGLVDLTVVRPDFLSDGVAYWLNRFEKSVERGLDGPRSVRGLPAQSTGDAIRWADMNGNGTTDIVISQAQSAPGEKVLVIDLVPQGKRHLLERIENGLGLVVTLSYESSSEQMVQAESAGEPWSSSMPVAVTVLSRIVETDRLSPAHEQAFTYRDPYYDPQKQEFRGFARTESREVGDASAEGKRTRLIFDTGRLEACRKGKLLSQEILRDDGKLFKCAVTTWGRRPLGTGVDGREVCFAFAASADEFIHEGEAEGVRLRTETDYDDYGNAVAERRRGVLETAGDEVFVERAFEPRTEAWQLDLLARETIRDGEGRMFAERRFSYDGRGNLEREEAWLDTEERFVLVLSQRFDAFGNVIERSDARGSRRSMAYDVLLHAWPVSESVHLAAGAVIGGDPDLVMTAELDLGFGVVSSAVSFSGEQTVYAHDALGRLIAKESPGGAGESYEYRPASPVSRVIKRRRQDAAGATFDAYSYTDGRGRPLLTKIEAEGGNWRALEARSYNSRRLESRLWLPFASETPEYETPDPVLPYETMTYDALGRPLETRKADGSRTRKEYLPLSEAVHDGNDLAGTGRPDVHRSDGLGRIASVEEQNGAETYTTRYGWNPRGELVSVADAQGNRKRFRFDALRRLVEVDDPDRGLLRFAYDDAGNRLRREDAKGQVITYAYDAANRTLSKVHRAAGEGGADRTEAAYHYDLAAGTLDFGDGTSGSARNVQGRLAWIEDPSGEEHFSYDERGNIEWVLKRVREPATGLLVPYRMQRRWDLLDREAELVFPDNDRLRYVYGAGSFVTRIDGGPQGETILAAAEYAATGQPLSLSLGNGAESSFEYDASQRLERLRTIDAAGAEILRRRLEYDEVSNVIAVLDERPLERLPEDSPRRATVHFAYDELHRLTRATFGPSADAGRIDYVYDAVGNLVSQSTPAAGMPGRLDEAAVDLGVLNYAGGRSGREGRRPGDPPGPHAATGTQAGNRFEYDSNGNLSALDGAALAWDFEDRLLRFSRTGVAADYLYDHAGRRVAKQVARGGAREATVYVDPAFEVRGGAAVKYALLEGRRLTRIEGWLDPGRERVQRIVLAAGWNLVAAAVDGSARLRDAFGADAAVYEASNASYAPLDSASRVPAGKALWVHVPAPRLAVLRGPAAADHTAASAGPLHAWPRLEPFRPALHLESNPALSVYDAASRRWLRRDPSLPPFLSEAPEELGAGQAFWSPGTVELRPSAAAALALVHYHQDHVGSTAALTDADGSLIEERTHYPYGALRAVHRPDAPGANVEHDFTGKERDRESGLTVMGARSYLDLAGNFLSPDPRFLEAAALASGTDADKQSFAAYLANPQMGNPYAYALRNPLKLVDPSGLEVVISPALRDTPAFMKAWKIFQGTKEGQRLLKALEATGTKIHLRASRADVRDYYAGQGTNDLGEYITPGRASLNFDFGKSRLKDNEGAALINIYKHKEIYGSKDRLVLKLADTIHHELRHGEAEAWAGYFHKLEDEANAADRASGKPGSFSISYDPMVTHDRLDAYKTPSLDPYNAAFQKEIGLKEE